VPSSNAIDCFNIQASATHGSSTKLWAVCLISMVVCPLNPFLKDLTNVIL